MKHSMTAFGMKTLALATSLTLTIGLHPAYATLINVDINLADGTPENYAGGSANGPIAGGSIWNSFAIPTDGGANLPNSQTMSSLVDAAGIATTVDVAFGLGWVGTFEDTGPNNLQRDRAYTQFQSFGHFTISGHADGGLYDIALINSDVTNPTEYTIGGTTLTATGSSAGANVNGPLTFSAGQTHVLFSGIEATGGSIAFSAKQASGSSFAVLSGLQIQSVAVPEPSILALLGIGATMLLAARRRNVRD